MIAVVQPHRYTRLEALMEDFQKAFNDADIVFVAPVYPAGEEPIEGVDSAALVEGLRAGGHRMVQAVADAKDLAARCATSRPKATWSFAWARATSPNGRPAWPTRSATARTSK